MTSFAGFSMPKSTALVVAVLAVLLGLNMYQTLSLQAENRSLSLAVSSLAAELPKVSTTTVRETVTVLAVSSEAPNYSALYEAVKDSVVMIRVFSPTGSGVGSGFLYDSEGHVVTNNHVVRGGSSFRVVFNDGSMYRARVVGTDVDSDLAVLRIENPPAGLKSLRLGNSSELKIGEIVVAIGNPFGLEGTLTAGIVSQKGRLLQTGRGFSIPGVIQTDAAINPGNSGGPLLNLRGEVVGVNTAIEASGVGIGYAVPSSIVARVVPALIRNGSYQRSWMGISATTLDADIAAAMGAAVSRGVLIVEVVANSPAQRAGLRGGDRTVVVNGVPVRVGGDIVTAVDGVPVASMDDLLLYMEERTSPGQTITLTVWRGSEQTSVKVVLTTRP
ncbi:MAG: trypsin-like peptidase domain-containing protein [Candidatus Caldarchaeum sp.]|nr:trypsin-like peptidase domain-containing protein [Candidatus Caldarchaeum sp.]